MNLRAQWLDVPPTADLDELETLGPSLELADRAPRYDRAPEPLRRAAWPVGVYVGSRLLVLAVALVVAAAEHRGLGSLLSLFDGGWYLKLAAHGYPSHEIRVQSTLGFLPLYPLVMRAVAFVFSSSYLVAGLLISLAGGLLSTFLVQRLATSWWGETTGRRAALLFCFFPGSIVFSMLYSESLLVPLGLCCFLALKSKRYGRAGLAVAAATAVAPVAVILVAVCAVAAMRELRSSGWHEGRRSLLAPMLAPLGLCGFAIFLWCWTGTPFATLAAQHYGWHQQAEPLGIFALPVTHHILESSTRVGHDILNWSLWNGIFGAIFLALSLVGLYRSRKELSEGVLLWCFGIAFVNLWSVMTPPNARMILVATPAVLIWARRLSSRRLPSFVAVELVFFAAMSALTLSGHMVP